MAFISDEAFQEIERQISQYQNTHTHLRKTKTIIISLEKRKNCHRHLWKIPEAVTIWANLFQRIAPFDARIKSKLDISRSIARECEIELILIKNATRALSITTVNQKLNKTFKSIFLIRDPKMNSLTKSTDIELKFTKYKAYDQKTVCKIKMKKRIKRAAQQQW